MLFIKILILSLLIIFFKGVVLSMIAKVLSFILEVPNLICATIVHFKKSQFIKVIDDYQFQSALENDIFLHYNFRALWNVCLSNGHGYKYGTNKDETLSSAIGRKYIESTLSWVGLIIYFLLYIVDYSTWFKSGHCIAAYKEYVGD